MLTQLVFSPIYRGKSFIGTNGNTFYLCDGQAISRTSNFRLAAVWPSAAYGGDGSNIHLPPLHGLYLRGYDFGSGRDVDASLRVALSGIYPFGNNIGAYQAPNMLSHIHTLGTQGGAGNCSDGGGQDGGGTSVTPLSSTTSTSVSISNTAFTNVIASGSTVASFDVSNCSFYVYIQGN